MKRGDLVTVVAPGGFGKPRPAVVVQASDLDDVDTVLVCLVTTFERDAPHFRLSVRAGIETGLRQPSQIMVEKIHAVRRTRCGERIGRLDRATLAALNECLVLVLGLGEI